MQFRLACTKIPKDVLLLEIGPHALMRSPLRQNRSDLQYVATMKKGDSAVDTLTAAVADLWRKGAIFNWPALSAPAAAAHPEREFVEHFAACPAHAAACMHRYQEAAPSSPDTAVALGAQVHAS